MSTEAKNSTLQIPAGAVYYEYELATTKKTGLVKDGTGGSTGIPAQNMSTSRTMFLEMSSRLYLGATLGFMPTQYVIGASTHYVNDYWEDKKGKPVFEKLTPEEGKAKGYTYRPGLQSIYGVEGLEKELVKSKQMGICFESGVFNINNAKSASGDPVFRKFVEEHEQNKNAPNAADNKDRSRLRLFMFQPRIPELKAAKSKPVDSFDDKFEAMTLVASLREKKTDGSYTYHLTKINALLGALEDGVTLGDGDPIQKFELIVRLSNLDPQKFMEVVNGRTGGVKIQLGMAATLKVIDYGTTSVSTVENGKKTSVYTFDKDKTKEEVVSDFALHLLGTKEGRATYDEIVRLNEKAKIDALN